jgi:hypothetical protein
MNPQRAALAAYARGPLTHWFMHVEVRPRKDKRGVDLISGALPFGRLWYGEQDAINNAIGYAKFLQPLTSRCDLRLRRRCPESPVSTCNAGWRKFDPS